MDGEETGGRKSKRIRLKIEEIEVVKYGDLNGWRPSSEGGNERMYSEYVGFGGDKQRIYDSRPITG